MPQVVAYDFSESTFRKFCEIGVLFGLTLGQNAKLLFLQELLDLNLDFEDRWHATPSLFDKGIDFVLQGTFIVPKDYDS
ncbi:MAG: hypothetical protein ACRCXZ_09420 [Patescibacteria group bacterium]